jgi:signal transduction histidine kinase
MSLRLTITRRIAASLTLVIAVAVTALLIIHDGLARVVDAVRELADVREPTYSALLEVELNVNGSVMAAFAYLDDPQPHYREIARKDERDIATFHARFLELAETDAERRLGARLGELTLELHATVARIMDTRDEQSRAWTEFSGAFENTDRIIDADLVERVDRNAPGAAEKLTALAGLESDLARVGVSVEHARREGTGDRTARITANAKAFRASLRSLRDQPLLDREARSTTDVERTFERMMRIRARLLALDDDMRAQSTRLSALRTRMDNLLDEEIQAGARYALGRPRAAAEKAASSALRNMQWLGVLVLLIAIGTGIALTRSISRPVSELKKGTVAVGRGDLTHRIPVGPERRDELTDLAVTFNDMVERLRSTTVSKELLERSEQRLLETVGELRREIAERVRAEEEQVRLETSLRRSETMSAMGALVAGVAHEVRNPLFGMLSVLDAMDARFAARAEYARYLSVLREEAERLNRLMRELLEYGKPLNSELVPGSMAGVVEQAVASCRGAADQARVHIERRIPPQLPRVMTDRDRLVRVFVNLLENAIQHSPAGATVLLEAHCMDEEGSEWIVCTVTDTGPGFPPDDLPRIFEPFFSRRPQGTGLGLSIAQRIVEEHGGHVTVFNRDGGGAAAIVRLPACAGAPAVFVVHHAEA